MPDAAFLDIRFKGLAQRKSRYGFAPGDLTLATNVAFDKLGTITKRPGQNGTTIGTTAICDKPVGSLVGPANLTQPTVGAFQFGSEEVRLASTNRLYALAGGSTKQISRDYFAEAVGTRRPLQNLSGSLDYLAPDVAITTSGYEVYAWCAVNGEFAGASPVYTLVYEQASGAMVLQPSVPLNQAAAGVWTPKLVVVGGTLVVAVYPDVAGNLYMRTLDTSGALPFAWGAETVLMAAAGAAPLLAVPVFDVTVMPGDTHFAVAWTYSVGGGNLGVYCQLFTTAGAAVATASRSTFPNHASVLKNTTTIPLIALCGLTTDSLYLGWCEQDDAANWQVGVWGLSPTTLGQDFAPVNMLGVTQASVSLPQQLGACTNNGLGYGINGSGAAFVFAADDAVNNSVPATWVLFVKSTGAVTNLAGPQLNWWPSSRPFTRACAGGLVKTYCLAYYPSQVQGTYFLVDLNTDNAQGTFVGGDRWARPVCSIANRLATSVAATQLRPNNSLSAMPAAGVNGAQYITPGHVLAGGGSLNQFRLWRLQVDFAHPNRGVAASLGHMAVFGSSFYDGQRAVEMGHYLFPEGYSLTDQGGGGNLSAGTYQYIVIYSWTSASGDTFRSTSFGLSNGSPPTQAVSITLAASHSVKVGLLFNPPLTTMADAESNTGCGQNTFPVSTTFGAVNVEIYRTVANGTIFYLVATVAVPNQQALGVSGVTTYVDNLADAGLSTNAELYFAPGGGGLLECVSPPSFSHTIVYVQRVWGIGDDLRTIWYSKQYADGEAPGFNEQLTLQVEDGTDLVCLAPLQTQLLICTKKSWYVVYGTGPDDSGAGNDLTQPQPLIFDQVCANLLSLCEIPQGIVFQAANNQLYLIGTGLSCTWFSDRVEDLLNAYPQITSAVWMADRHELRIAANNPGGTGVGIVLVWNGYVDAWSVWTVNGALGAGDPSSAAMVSSVGGIPTYRWSGSAVLWTEDAASLSWLDVTGAGSAWVTLDLETGWINLPEVVGGYGRVRKAVVVGDSLSPFDLTLEYGSNYNPSYTAPTGQSLTFTDVATGAVPSEMRMSIVAQVSHAMRVRLTDGPPTGGGGVGTGQGMALAALSLEYAPEDGIGKFVSLTQQG